MLKTKQEIDRHVHNLLSRIKDERDRHSRGFQIAKLYFDAKEYEIAKRYLAGYINVRDNISQAHKLMGQILEATGQYENAITSYKRCLDIDTKQTDAVLKICELYCKTNVDSDRAKYWAGRGEQLFPGNSVVFRLKEKSLVEKGESGTQEVEDLVTSELVKRPNDVSLRVRLIKLYMNNGRTNEAYEHAMSIERTGAFVTSLEWCEQIVELFQMYKVTPRDELSYYTHKLYCLRNITDLHLQNREVVDASKSLNLFDLCLQETTQLSSLQNNVEWNKFLTEMKGELFYLTAVLLLKRATKNQLAWKDAVNLAAACLLVSQQFPALDTRSEWYVKATQGTQRVFWSRVYLIGNFRLSQTGHMLATLSQGDATRWARDVKTKVCTSAGRQRVYETVFTLRELRAGRARSFIMNNAAFCEFEPRVVTRAQLEDYDRVTCELRPDSLDLLVWLGLQYYSLRDDTQPTYCFDVFDDLECNLEDVTKPPTPESLSKLDTQVFLYASVRCAAVAGDSHHELAGRDPSHPDVLPLQLMQTLCCPGQRDWWKAAYSLTNNLAKEKLSRMRLVLQRGLETVRLAPNHGVSVSLMVHLAQTLEERETEMGAKSEGTNSPDASFTATRSMAVHYWTKALELLHKMQRKEAIHSPAERLFHDDQQAAPDAVKVASMLADGESYLATVDMREERFEAALARFTKILTPTASYHMAQIYRQLANREISERVKEEMTEDVRVKYLSLLMEARKAFYTTLDRLQNDRNHHLHKALASDLDDIESKISRAETVTASALLNESDESEREEGVASMLVMGSIPDVDTLPVHSTPIAKGRSPYVNFQNSLSQSSSRLRPSPERLEAQIRALSISHDTVIKTVLERNEELVRSNREMVGELKESRAMIKQLQEFMMKQQQQQQLQQQQQQQQQQLQQQQQQQQLQQQQQQQQLQQRQQQQQLQQQLHQQQHPPGQIPSYAAYIPTQIPKSPYTMAATAAPQPQPNAYMFPQFAPYQVVPQPNGLPPAGVHYGPMRRNHKLSVSSMYAREFAGDDDEDAFDLDGLDYNVPEDIDSIAAHNPFPNIEWHTGGSVDRSYQPPSPQQPTQQNTGFISVVAQPKQYFAPPPAVMPQPGFFAQTGQQTPGVAASSPMSQRQTPSSAVNLSNLHTLAGAGSDKTPSPKDISIFLFGTRATLIDTLMHPESCTVKVFLSAANGTSQTTVQAVSNSHVVLLLRYVMPDVRVEAQLFAPSSVEWNQGSTGEKYVFKFIDVLEAAKFIEAVHFPRGYDLPGIVAPANVVKSSPVAVTPGALPSCAVSGSLLSRLLSDAEASEAPKQQLQFGVAAQNLASLNSRAAIGGQLPGTEVNKSLSTIASLASSTPQPPKPFAGFSFSSVKMDKPAPVSADVQNWLNPQATVKSPVAAVSSPAKIFPSPARNDSREDIEEFEPTVEFKPVISLPDAVEIKTGEEDETIAFKDRAKLYRYDAESKQWKERGIGEIKILKHQENGSFRIIMRRDQVFKVCANHNLTADIKLTPMSMSDRAWCWNAADYSEGEIQTENFAIRFKTKEQALEFKTIFEASVKEIGESKQIADLKPPAEKSAPEAKPQTSWANIFKPTKGAWECSGCLIQNQQSVLKCPACNTLKPGVKAEDIPKDLSTGVNSAKSSLFASLASKDSTSKGFSFLSTAASSAPVFGGFTVPQSAANSAPPPTGGFSFASSSISAPSANSGFVFGQNNPLTPEAFGRNATGTPAPKPATSSETIPSAFSGFSAVSAKPTVDKPTPTAVTSNQTTPSFGLSSFAGLKPSKIDNKPQASGATTATTPSPFAGFAGFGVVSAPKIVTTTATSTTNPDVTAVDKTKTLTQLLKPDGPTWDCPGCYLRNSGSVDKCPACSTLKQGSDANDKPAPTTTTAATATITTSTTAKSSPFVFTPVGKGFAFGSTKPQSEAFSFASSPFKTPVFTVGTTTPKQQESPPETTKPSAATSLVFGATSSSVTNDAGDKPKLFAFGGSSTFTFTGVTPQKAAECVHTIVSPKSPEIDEHGHYVNKDDEDSHIFFEPVVRLPDKVDVLTGEENEEVLFEHRAKLYRFSDAEWKERGIGEIRILQDREVASSVRVVMRREQIHKICCNFHVTAEMDMKAMAGGKAWLWHCEDFTDGVQQHEQLSARFKNQEIAADFKKAFDVAQSYIRADKPPAPSDGADGVNIPPTDDPQDDLVCVSTERATPAEIEAARRLLLPDNFYLYKNLPPCKGCLGCTDGDMDALAEMIRKSKSKKSAAAEKTPNIQSDSLHPSTPEKVASGVKESSSTPFSTKTGTSSGAGFAFGTSFGTSLGGTATSFATFESLVTDNTNSFTKKSEGMPFSWQGSGQKLFGASPNKTQTNSDAAADDDEVIESDNIHFDPIIRLPENVHIKTGEEDETAVFSERAKLFRFDKGERQWKERGVGEMKIMQHNTTARYRLLLRRDQIFKVACNHLITPDLQLNPMGTSESAWCWVCTDFSDDEPKLEQFAAKFKNVELSKKFHDMFIACQAELSSSQSAAIPTVVQSSVGEADSTTGGAAAYPRQRKETEDDDGGGDESEEDYDENGEEDGEYYDEDEYEDMTVFEKRATLMGETGGQWKVLGLGDICVTYEDDVGGHRIAMETSTGQLLCSHIITKEYIVTCDSTKKTCEWYARDFATDEPVDAHFCTKFSSAAAAQEFMECFNEGLKLANENDISKLHVMNFPQELLIPESAGQRAQPDDSGDA